MGDIGAEDVKIAVLPSLTIAERYSM